MAARVDPMGPYWKWMDMDQLLLKRYMKVTSNRVWKQTVRCKMPQGRICELWRLAWT